MTDTRDRRQTVGADMRQPGMPQGQAPANRPQMTAMQRAAAERQDRYAAFIHAATENQATIERSLKYHGIAFDFFMAALDVGLRNTMKGDPVFFEKVSPQSFLEAVLKATHLGLLPDGKEGAVVRFGEDAAFLAMVEGFVKVLWQTGVVVEINHNVVCDGDDFDFEEGDEGFVTHRRSLRRAKDAEVIGAWCVIKLNTGGKLIEICDQADLKQIASVSRAQKGPRVDWAREMHRKAPFRRLVKRMPKSAHLADLIAHDDGAYDLTRPVIDQEKPVVGRAQLFSDRVAHRRPRPAPAEPVIDEPIQETQLEPEEAGEPEAKPEFVHAVAAISQADGFVELGEARTAALALCDTDDERQWVEETTEARRKALGPPEEKTDEGFVLMAVISSATGPRPYDEVGFWRSDIITKLDAAKGDVLKAFWAKNRPFVIAARDNGFAEDAERILALARANGLEAPDV